MSALNHPSLTNPDYNTIMLSWQNGGLAFFETMPNDGSGMVILDTYYFAYLLSFLFGGAFTYWAYKNGSFKVTRTQWVDLIIVSILGVFVGAKLGYVLFYNLEYYLQNPAEIFLNWSGMASHGALGGTLLALWLYSKKQKIPYLHILDHAVIAGTFGAIFIRFANWLNAELYGRSAPEALPWATRFPMRNGFGEALFVDQSDKVYALKTFTENGQMLQNPYGRLLEQAPHHAYESYSKVAEILPNQIWKLRIESENGPVIQVARLITDPSHPSQFYQMIVSGFILLTVLFFIRKRAKKLGTVALSFFIGYGVSRFLMEYFRQQDPQRSTGIFEYISMGQILSLGLIAVGCLIYYYQSRRPQQVYSS